MKKNVISSLMTGINYRRELVDVPELGTDAQIYVREMSVQGLLDYQAHNFDQVGKPLADNPYQWMISLIVACTCNEGGTPLATQDNVLELMEKLPKSVMERLLPVCQRLNDLVPKALADAKNESAPAQESS
jgi:hypothetical protein